MRWEDQGAEKSSRHVVVPRTLCFLRWHDKVLLLRGAATKRLWAGKWNGIGGHIEVGETPLAGALREIAEETGLVMGDLRLRGVVHICSPEASQGIMLFVYVGEAPSREVRPSTEGELRWFTVGALPDSNLVEDLVGLVPRVLEVKDDQLVYGLYQPDEQGHTTFSFNTV